jgi:hypothetical protein
VYGIVNKSIEDLVVANFGREMGMYMKKSGIDVDFLSNVYDDTISNCYRTFRRNEYDFESSSTFGEWWVYILHLRSIQG